MNIIFGATLSTVAGYGVNYFLAAYLSRRYGLNYAQAGLLVGLISSVPASLSFLAGGFLADFECPRMRPVRKPGRMQRNHPRMDIIAAEKLPLMIKDNLVKIVIGMEKRNFERPRIGFNRARQILTAADLPPIKPSMLFGPTGLCGRKVSVLWRGRHAIGPGSRKAR